jgi:hypothetical protein
MSRAAASLTRSASLIVAVAALAGCVAGRRAVVVPATDESALVDPAMRARATMNGKYESLIATFTVPEDAARWGSYHDYGWWPGGTWAGVSGIPPGYWVYIEPTWYIWQRLAPREPAPTPVAP